jgi:hypothetical protein
MTFVSSVVCLLAFCATTIRQKKEGQRIISAMFSFVRRINNIPASPCYTYSHALVRRFFSMGIRFGFNFNAFTQLMSEQYREYGGRDFLTR